MYMKTELRNILARLQITLVKHKLLISLIVVASLVIIGVVLVAGRSNKQEKGAPPPLAVEVVQVEQQDVPVYSEWIGTTDGMVNADIRAQVTGYLLRQNYKEGSFVKRGQLLFEIDPRPFQAALEQANGEVAQFQGQLGQANSQLIQAEAQLAQANSQLSQAQAQLARAQANQVRTQLDVNKYAPLAEQKAVTQQDYDNAIQANVVAKADIKAAEGGIEAGRAQVRVANAQIGTAKAAIATAKGQVENASAAVKAAALNLGFTRIISPIDGIAGSAQAQIGNLISAASPLTTVSTLDPIKFYFTLGEQEYLLFNKHNLIGAQPSTSVAQLELELILSDGTTFPQKGRFFFADRQVDPTTGAIRLAGIFLNPGNVLRPGQYGRVRAVTSVKEGALLIPQRAISELQGSYQVALVGADKKVSIRGVKVSERSGSMWVVEDGLKLGELVVAEGTQKVRPGMTVEPKPFAGTVTVAQQ